MTELSIVRTDAEDAYLGQFEAAKAALAGSDWSKALREEAIARFRETGLPHRRVEEWKYTDLRMALRDVKALAGEAAVALPQDRFDAIGRHVITIANGRVTGELPSVEGVTITRLSDALTHDGGELRAAIEATPARGDNPVYALNTALMADGLAIEIAPGAEIDKPLHIRTVFAGDNDGATFTRIAVVAGEGAKATLLETFDGPQSAYQTNIATTVIVGKNAEIDHFRVQTEGGAAIHLANLICEIGEEAHFNLLNYVQGAALSRLDLSLAFKGENANCNIRGANLLSGKQHGDITMFVDHAVPYCESSEIFKTVLGGTARGVFQGKILVRPHAQKTDGQMSANAIMLSDEAEMDVKPELEIYADDVVCGHGATSGQLDEDLLFYLKARGIGDREAKALMIAAFVGEAFEDIGHDDLADVVLAIANEWISEAEI